MAPPKQPPLPRQPPKLGYLAPLRQAVKLYFKVGLPLPCQAVDFPECAESAAAATAPSSAPDAASRAKRAMWRNRAAALRHALGSGNKVRIKSFTRACRRGYTPSNRAAPRSRNSRVHASVRTTLPRWDRLRARRLRQRRSILRTVEGRTVAATKRLHSACWIVRQPEPAAGISSAPEFRFEFTRTYDPEKEMSNFSFEEIVAAERMVQLNRDWRTQITRA